VHDIAAVPHFLLLKNLVNTLGDTVPCAFLGEEERKELVKIAADLIFFRLLSHSLVLSVLLLAGFFDFVYKRKKPFPPSSQTNQRK
jgi:hypothetical protein